MPTGALTGNFATQSTRPLSIWAGQRDITALLIADTLEFEDAGASQGELVGTLNSTLANLPEVTDRAFVRVFDEVRATEMYRGFLVMRAPTLEPTLATVRLRADDHGLLLDRYIPGPEERPIESDRTRIGYLWGKYASPMLSPDLTDVDVVVASVPAQDYAGTTLRRALDMIAAASSPGADWYVDQTGHLHYFASETRAAPKDVTSDTPGGGEVAAAGLAVDFGDSSYANAVYVAGATAAGSGWIYDYDEIARVGTQISATLQASECETAAMRNALGNMYLGRVSASATRGSFTVYSHDADGWRAGQTLTVRSASIGINAAYRIARVRTKVIGPSIYQYGIEFGASRRGAAWERSSEGGIGVGNLIYGELGAQSNTYVTADGVAVTDGTNVRAQIGKITATDYGLRVISSDGTTVIIDGTSDMFRIAATGTDSFPVCGASSNASNSVIVETGLSYRPIAITYLYDGTYAHPIPWTTGATGSAPTTWWLKIEAYSATETRLWFSVESVAGAGSQTCRYYILDQVAL